VAAGEVDGEFQGRFYNDSDVYKWLEGACYFLTTGDDPELRERVDELADLIAAAQEEDGYFNTYFQLVEPDKKWTNLHVLHELYCAGHLFEAAIAHHEATGAETLLTVANDFADHVDRSSDPTATMACPATRRSNSHWSSCIASPTRNAISTSPSTSSTGAAPRTRG